MHTFHFSRRLRACVLSWVLMAMAAALASPLLHHGTLDLVCSASGQIKLLQQGDTPDESHTSTLDCLNCLLLGPLPYPSLFDAARSFSVERTRRAPQSAPTLIFNATPPPARGPPYA